MKLASYLRMSTDRQEASPGTQRRILADWASRNGHVIVAEYLDEALSGGKSFAKRPGASAILADSRAKPRPWDGICFFKRDRFGRDKAERETVFRDLHKRGIAMLTPEGPINLDTASERLIESIIGAVDQHEREVTGERIKAHNLARMLQGKLPNGQVCMGYSYDKPSQVVSVNDRADDVRQIFAWYLETGGNATEVTRRANRAGMIGVRGKPFSVVSISQILKAPMYRRRLAYGDREIDAPDTIPEIVPPHVLAVADTMLARVRTIGTRSRGIQADYAGMMRCAECGGRLYQSATTAAGTRYNRWFCPSRSFGLCGFVRVSERIIHPLVGRAVARALEGYSVASDYAPDVEAVAKKSREQQESRLRQQRARWAELYVDGVIDRETMDKRVKDVDDELAALAKVPTGGAIPVLTPAEAAVAGQGIIARWPDMQPSDRRSLLLTLSSIITVESTRTTPRAVTLETSISDPVREANARRSCVNRWVNE